jgi:hypothetical protein
MYKFLLKYLPKSIANFVMGLWYFFLIAMNIYCIASGAQGAFQYVGW